MQSALEENADRRDAAEKRRKALDAFLRDFSALLARAVADGVPLPEIILATGDAEHELRDIQLQRRRTVQAAQSESAIVRANGLPQRLPPGIHIPPVGGA